MIRVSTVEGDIFDDCAIVVNAVTGTTNLYRDKGWVQLYPNPAKDKLCFEFSDNNQQHRIRIFDNSGKPVYETATMLPVYLIDLKEHGMEGMLSVHVMSERRSRY